MKSPQEVAAAKEEFLDELDRRVGRFARGADLSPRYARELHDWLAERYGHDAHFADALTALGGYRAKVGEVEATAACVALLRVVHEEVEGPRFPWRGGPEGHEEEWRAAFAEPGHGVHLASPCPICGEPTLRRYGLPPFVDTLTLRSLGLFFNENLLVRPRRPVIPPLSVVALELVG